MSRVYFHSPEDEAIVRGSERAYMGICISDWFESTLAIPRFFEANSPIFNFIPKDSYLYRDLASLDPRDWLRFRESFRAWLGSSGDRSFVIGNYKVDLFGAQLNTAYLMGSDAVKLMARLHGQCEVHCYVESQNREWLAQIIERGLATAIYRKDQGWEDAIALLRNGHNSPVVTSYNVCEQFPNAYIAGFEAPIDEEGEKNWDAWYDLKPEAQWELGMQGIKGKGGLELKPDNWNDFYFAHGWDAFKFNHLLSIPQERWNAVARAFSETQLPAAEAWALAIAEEE